MKLPRRIPASLLFLAILVVSLPGAEGPVLLKRRIDLHGAAMYHVALADHNGDGVDDLLLASGNEVSIVDGLYGTSLRRLLVGDTGSFVGSIESIPDLDGDGKRDLFVGVPGDGGGDPDWEGVVVAVASTAPDGPVTPDSIVYRVGGRGSEPSLGLALGATGMRSIASSDRGVVVVNVASGEIVARIEDADTVSLADSVSGLGDLNGNGTEDFVIGGESALIFDGGVTTSDWTPATGEALKPWRLAALTSSQGLWPGVHGGAGDREMFADLGDPIPANGVRERLIVSADAHRSGVMAHVLVPKGDGTFEASEVATIRGATEHTRLGHDVAAIGDADGDGIAEVSVFERDSDAGGETVGRVLIVSGAGLLDGFGEGDILQEIGSDHHHRFYEALRPLGDYDRDGLVEFLVSGLNQEQGYGFVDIYVVVPKGQVPPDCNGNGSPDFVDLVGPRFHLQEARAYAAGSSPKALLAEDVDGDGDLDLIVGGAAPGHVSILRNYGDGSFPPPQVLGLEWDVFSLAAGDFNRDGSVDLATADYGTHEPAGGYVPGNTVSILLNRGDGTFVRTASVTVGETPDLVLPGDIDGDGDVDLIARGGPMTVLRNDGAGRFDASPLSTDYSGIFQALALADLDGDQDLDMAVSGDMYQITALRNTGSGDFLAGPPSEDYAGGDTLVAGDLDRDGDLDIAAARPNAYGITVVLNRGDATFGPASAVVVGGAEAYCIATGDLDGDGDLDLATGNRNGEAGVWAFHNMGAAIFFDAEEFRAGGMPTAIAAADLNRDEKVDLAVLNTQTEDVSVLLNLTDTPKTRDCNRNGKPDECDIASGLSMDRTRNGIPDECEVVWFHRGDASGDGALDLVDAVHVLGYTLFGTKTLDCHDAADANNDDRVDISDAIFLLGFLFRGGPVPPSPGAPPSLCGPDPAGVGTAGDLGCDSYWGC